MTILSLTSKGALRLPADAMRHLRGARQLQLRCNAHGITLTPVRVEVTKAKDFPAEKGGNS